MQKLIKTFTFAEDDRSALAFSDSTKIVLDSRMDAVRLRATSDGVYPTDDGIYVLSRVTAPAAARKLVGFQAFVDHVKVEDDQVTSDGFRLYDGTTHYFWNGSAWTPVLANSSSWNTEAEVATNIAAFTQFLAASPRRFAVAVKLRTTDKRYTPVLRRVKIAYEVRIYSYLEDLLYRSLVRDMKAKLRPVSDIAWDHLGGTTVDIADAIETTGIPYNLMGVDAVFNETDDPELLTDLLQGYDPGTKVATLTQSVDPGKSLRIEAIIEPEVIVETTHQDYLEVAKTPSVIIDELAEVNSAQRTAADAVVNKETGEAIIVPAPYQGDLRMRITATGPTSVEAKRIIEAVREYVERNPILRSKAIDEGYRLRLLNEYRGETRPSGNGIASESATVELMGILFFRRAAFDGFAVRQINFTARNIRST